MTGELIFVIFYGGCLIVLGIIGEYTLRRDYKISKEKAKVKKYVEVE